MDKVSGRGARNTGYQSSRLDCHGTITPCDQCMESGQVRKAEGFCESCIDFLCRYCIELHGKLRMSRNHTVLSGSDMPKQRPSSIVTNDVEKCSDHPDRPLEVYCVDEDTVGCALCFVEGHRACEKVVKISNLSKNIQSSREMSDINEASLNNKELCKQYRAIIQVYKLANDRCHAQCLEDYEHFRTEIQAALDRMGEEVSDDTAKVHKENTEKLNYLEEQISWYEQKDESLMGEIERCMKLDHKQNDQLFIAVKKNKTDIFNTVYELQQIAKSMHIQQFDFDFKPDIKQMLETECKISTNRNVLPVQCTDISKTYVASQGDRNNCSIRGMVTISDEEIILIDTSNKCLKFVDLTENEIINRRKLPSAPFDVCKIYDCVVAVSLPEEKKIQFYTADGEMDSRGCIRVDGECLGLYCMGDGRLAVSYCRPDPNIQIMDLKGRVIQTIKHGTLGQELFSQPEYITFSAVNRFLYVSDYANDTLTCMDVTGSVQWVYNDEELSGPEGVVIGDSGCLYLCSRDNHTIHLVSSFGVKLYVIYNNYFKFMYPLAICYDSNYRTLYVSSDGHDHDNPEHINCISTLRLE